jgi:hypothetical protein
MDAEERQAKIRRKSGENQAQIGRKAPVDQPQIARKSKPSGAVLTKSGEKPTKK